MKSSYHLKTEIIYKMSCEFCKKGFPVIVSCEYCTFVSCKKCVKAKLTDQNGFPECPRCTTRWSISWLRDSVGESFVKTIIQPKIKLILWELEQPYIIMGKVQAERRKTNIQTEALIREKEQELKRIANEIYELKKTLRISSTPAPPVGISPTPVSPVGISSTPAPPVGISPTPPAPPIGISSTPAPPIGISSTPAPPVGISPTPLSYVYIPTPPVSPVGISSTPAVGISPTPLSYVYIPTPPAPPIGISSTPLSPVGISSTPAVGISPTPVPLCNERKKNPHINMFCPSYVPVTAFSVPDLLVKTDKYGPQYKEQLMNWYIRLDLVTRMRLSEPSDQNEWRILHLLNELSEEDYRSKLYSHYKENEQHREQVEQNKAYISLSYYLMNQLSEYLESVFVNAERIKTLFETEEEMRSVLL